MPLPVAEESELQCSVRKLSIGEKGRVRDVHRPKPAGRGPPPKEEPVAESWEDEADSSEDDEKGKERDSADDSMASLSASPSITNAEGPLDPPPTPISPITSRTSPQPWLGAAASEQDNHGGAPPLLSRHKSPTAAEPGPGPARRPEKQTAVAGRMIAGALGIRTPKRTPEQREYDRAIKEQEIRRRNREKEQAAKEKEEEERAKAAIWED